MTMKRLLAPLCALLIASPVWGQPGPQPVPNPLPITAGTTGADSTYSAQGGTSNALITNSAVQVATGAHSLKGWDFVNNGASTCYVQVFDLVSGSVTLGTTVPKVVKWVPAGGAWEEKFPDEGVAFTNAITIAATTTTTGSTACSTALNANLNWK